MIKDVLKKLNEQRLNETMSDSEEKKIAKIRLKAPHYQADCTELMKKFRSRYEKVLNKEGIEIEDIWDIGSSLLDKDKDEAKNNIIRFKAKGIGKEGSNWYGDKIMELSDSQMDLVNDLAKKELEVPSNFKARWGGDPKTGIWTTEVVVGRNF